MAGPRAGWEPTATSSAPRSPQRDAGDGVVVLGDLGSAILTVRAVLEDGGNGHVALADAPLVEGAVAAAVASSASLGLADVLRCAEEANGASKL